MLRPIDRPLPTIRGLAPDTLIRVETIDGYFRVVAIEAEITIYLPAFEIRAREIEELLLRDGEL